MTQLHLLRHGRVASPGGRRCYGHTDYPLSETGAEESRRLVEWVEAWIDGVDGVLTSDLVRCTALAEPLAAKLGVELQVDSRLREQHMGQWEGLTWAALTERDVAGVRAYWSDYVNTAPPGGESFRDFAARVDGCFVERWPMLRGGRWVVVCHAGVARALCCRLLGLDLSEALRFAPVPASHTWFQLAEAGAVLQTLGERPFAQSVGAAAGKGTAGHSVVSASSPRIALSGSAGTGKTTLGRSLAATLGVPYIPEGMRARLEAGLDVHALGHSGLRSLVEELWTEQVAREDEAVRTAGGFVADRSPADYAAFWMTYRFNSDRSATERFLARTLGRVDQYDRIVCLPWGVLPLESDGIRADNPWVQRAYQALLEGFLSREVPPERLAMMPRAVAALEARVAWVLDQIGEAGNRSSAEWGSANRR